MTKPICSALILTLGLLANACSSNVFEPVETHDPAEEAAALLDEQKSDEAIALLEDAIAKDPGNFQLISIMASAKAQKAGVDTFDLVIKLANEGVSGSNGIGTIMNILPAVTTENRTLLQESVTLLNSIPEANRSDSDNLKATIFNASFTALQAKFFDSDGDGSFTVEELQNLDDESANAIINSLLSASNSAVLCDSAEQNGVAAEKIEEIKAELDAQPGATPAEKLRNLLAAQGTSTEIPQIPAP